MNKLLIFGNSVLAQVMLFNFVRNSNYEITGFTVDSAYNNKTRFCDYQVFDFETITETHPPSQYEMFIAIGPSQMNTLREKKFAEAKAKGYKLASYISPRSICDSPIGENSILGDFAIIQPGAVIGHNNFFWEYVLISNSCEIANNCYFSPKSTVSTFAKVANNSILGTNSVIKTCVHVAEKTLVGASCYISKETLENSIYGERNSEFLGQISHKVNISAQ